MKLISKRRLLKIKLN